MTSCRLTLLDTGYCVHPEHVVLRNWRLRTMRFPAMFALIEHPDRGPILFDTGYGQPYLDAVRTSFSGKVYNAVTPVTTSAPQFAAARLRAMGIDPSDVRTIICSHFHADHVAGLVDFPAARFLYFRTAWEKVARLRGVRALLNGFLPSLLPPDFEARSTAIEETAWKPLAPEYAPFTQGVDLFNDGSLIAVALPGHAAGQLGLFVRREEASDAFLVADACWTTRSFQEEIVPSSVTRLLFDSMGEYRESLGLVAEFHRQRPDALIVPSHCEALRSSAEFGPTTPVGTRA